MSMAYDGDNEVTIESMGEDIVFNSGKIHTIRAVACLSCEKIIYSASDNKKQFERFIRSHGWTTRASQWHCEDCRKVECEI